MKDRTIVSGRRAAAGFTLVELMVAMVGGMFVSIAVFALAKHASGFSLKEARLADATMQSIVGFERLKAEISRAGFLSTPNIRNNRSGLCGAPLAIGFPVGLRDLSSVIIDNVPVPQLSSEMTLNGIAPKRVTIAGSLASSDQFRALNIAQGNPVQVFLDPNSQGMVNIGYPPANDPATLSRVFGTGRALRIVDDQGRVQFASIAGVTGGPNPTITLGASPAPIFRSGSTLLCGISGVGDDFVNVVNIARYDIQNLNNSTLFPGFRHMFRGGPTYEATRRELTRQEVDVSGNLIAGTTELIAEYAVDLGFSLLVAPSTTSALVRASSDGDIASYAGPPAARGAQRGPQQIRAIHAWLSVRSQEADRTTNLSLTTTAPGPNRLRISVHPTSAALPPFARLRTVQATIPLNNQAKVSW